MFIFAFSTVTLITGSVGGGPEVLFSKLLDKLRITMNKYYVK
jgi:hypothetical protein